MASNHSLISQEEEKRYLELQELAMDFARQGEMDSLEKMLDHGLPINLADAKGNTLLMLACYHNHLSTVEMLLKRGADSEKKNNRGQTPLSGAIFKGYLEVVKTLIQSGAKIEDIAGSQSAIQLASLFGHKEIVQILGSLEQKNMETNSLSRLGPSSRSYRVLGFKPENLVIFTSKIKNILKLFKK